jgi:hypothetical protein
VEANNSPHFSNKIAGAQPCAWAQGAHLLSVHVIRDSKAAYAHHPSLPQAPHPILQPKDRAAQV